MIRYFEILAGSWPLALMFVATIVGCVIIYLIRWFKKSDEDDKAYRAGQAVVVRGRGDD